MCNRVALINQQKKSYPTEAKRQKIPLGHSESLGWMKSIECRMRGHCEEEEELEQGGEKGMVLVRDDRQTV